MVGPELSGEGGKLSPSRKHGQCRVGCSGLRGPQDSAAPGPAASTTWLPPSLTCQHL